MTDNHPITPPLKLFREWIEYRGTECEDQFWWRIATQAARWGADQELEACCADIHTLYGKLRAEQFRAARRPKPPSLKDQALEILGYPKDFWSQEEVDTIHRALEQLDEH